MKIGTMEIIGMRVGLAEILILEEVIMSMLKILMMGIDMIISHEKLKQIDVSSFDDTYDPSVFWLANMDHLFYWYWISDV